MKKLKNIVLIDDSKSTNSLNATVLSTLEIANQLHMFTSGADAIKYIAASTDSNSLPEVIFLDLVMPDMSGFEFLEKYIQIIDSKKADFEPVIVIVSDYLDFENFSKSKYYKTYGVLEHLRKPLDLTDVENLLEEHFQ